MRERREFSFLSFLPRRQRPLLAGNSGMKFLFNLSSQNREIDETSFFKKRKRKTFTQVLIEWHNKYTDFIVARARLKRPTNIAQEFDRKTGLSSNLYDASHIADH